MRHRQVPLCALEIIIVARLIFVITETNDILCFTESGSKIEISRSVLNRVATENDNSFNFASVQRLCEILNRAFFSNFSFAEFNNRSIRAERFIHRDYEKLCFG